MAGQVNGINMSGHRGPFMSVLENKQNGNSL